MHTCRVPRGAQELSMNPFLSVLLAHREREHFDEDQFAHTWQPSDPGKKIYCWSVPRIIQLDLIEDAVLY